MKETPMSKAAAETAAETVSQSTAEASGRVVVKDQPIKTQKITTDKIGANVRKPGPVTEGAIGADLTLADKKAAAKGVAATKPAPVEAAAVVTDPMLPIAHVAAKDDVAVWVPKSIGHYGLVDRGEQTLYEVWPADNAPLGRAGLVKVALEHVEKFLRNIEGSILVKPGTMTPEQEAAEAARPVGRRAGPPLTAEEVIAATEQAKFAGSSVGEAATPAPAPKGAGKVKK
jgi:hypothetical protein